MNIQILDLAKDDLIDGFYFYEEKETGLGDYFLSSLYSDIEALQFSAGVHRKAYRNLHRALSDRFPFAIYYSTDDESVFIRAIADCRRKPSWIRNHLEQA